MVHRGLQLIVGCVTLGVGVALLLTPALGSDGFSTLVNGLRISTGMPFLVANALLSGAFVGMAWFRNVVPGVGTIVQILIVGETVGWRLGAAIGPGTVAVLLLLGSAVALVGRLLRLDLHQPGPTEARRP